MNLRGLTLTVLVLALLAGLVFLLNRPGTKDAPDPLLGQPLLSAEAARQAARLEIIPREGDRVILAKNPAGVWVLPERHNLPVDFPKLSRFIESLRDAKYVRRVTSQPKRLERLNLGRHRLVLLDAAGATLLDLSTGDSGPSGGLFFRPAAAEAAYLTAESLFVDDLPNNWSQKTPLTWKTEDIQSLTLDFPGASPASLTFSRADAQAPITTPALPDGQVLKSSEVTTLLSSLTGLRFTEATARAEADVADALAHARTASLTTFSGQSATLRLGRRPERTIPAPATPSPAEPTPAEPTPASAVSPAETPPAEPATETIPAGPVYFTLETGDSSSPWTEPSAALGYRISEYLFNRIPADPAAFFEPAPAPAPADPAAPPAPDSAEPVTPAP